MMAASYHLSGISLSQQLYTVLDSLNLLLQKEWRDFISDPHPNFSLGRHVENQSVTELFRCRQVLGDNFRLSRLPLESTLHLAVMMSISNSAAEEEVGVIVSMANECLISIGECLVGAPSSLQKIKNTSGGYGEKSSFIVDIEESRTVLNIGEQEKCLQILLECFKYVLNPLFLERGDKFLAFVEGYFTTLATLQRSIGSVRKVFSKYIANDILNCCLKCMIHDENWALEKYILLVIRDALCGASSIDEIFRVSTQIVKSGEALTADDGSNPFRKFFICIYHFCSSSANITKRSSVKSFGLLFSEVLKACLRKCKVAGGNKPAYDGKGMQMVAKVCSAFLLQVSWASDTILFKNEILRHIADVSGTLLIYDPSGDLLELYSRLWGDAKVSLYKALESTSGDICAEVECLRYILSVHHRLILEGNGELDRICSLMLAVDIDVGNEQDTALGLAQIELLAMLLDLYHRLGRLSEVLSSLCKASRISTVAKPHVRRCRLVLGSEKVQKLISVSFAELSILQAADLWGMLAEESKAIVNLEIESKTVSMAALSLVCRAILAVVMSRPSSKRVEANRVTVPVAATFTLIEICLDIMPSSEGSQSDAIYGLRADSEVLAASLLRVASLLICQVSYQEMQNQKTMWKSFISLVLDRWINIHFQGDSSDAASTVNSSLFSAIVFVYVAQEQCGCVDDLPQTEALVRRFVSNYNASLKKASFSRDKEVLILQKSASKVKRRKIPSERVDATRGIDSPPPGFDAPLLQYTDVLSVIFASKDCTALYEALLTECWYLIKLGGKACDFLNLDSPVLAQAIQFCLTSSLEILVKDVNAFSSASSSKEEASYACRALDFYKNLVNQAPRGTRPLASSVIKLLEDILLSVASKHINRDHPQAMNPSHFHVARLISELFLVDIGRNASLSETFISSLASAGANDSQGEPRILGLMRLVAAANNQNEAPSGCPLSDLCLLLLGAVMEWTVLHDSRTKCTIDIIFSEMFSNRLSSVEGGCGHEQFTLLHADMVSTLCACLKHLTFEESSELKQKLMDSTSRVIASINVEALLSKSNVIDFHDPKYARNWYFLCKALLTRVHVASEDDTAPDILETAGRLFRHLITSFAAYNFTTTYPSVLYSLSDLWLTVLGDLLEIHRHRGLFVRNANDAIFIFRSIIRWLDHICAVSSSRSGPRSKSCRLALVRALAQLITVSRNHSEKLNSAVVGANRGLREFSTDAADSVRALFSASLANNSSISLTDMSAAREVLFDMTTNVLTNISGITAIQSDSGSDIRPRFTDVYPEEAAFFQCMLPEANADKKRKINEESVPIAGGEGRDGEVGLLSIKAIDTYAVLAAQAHTLLYLPGGAERTLDLCSPCLAALHEMCLSHAGHLSFCFPLYANAIGRIAHCLLLIGPGFPAQKHAIGVVRRVMLSISATKSLHRFFPSFAASMLEVLVACGSNGRHGAEPLVSGILTLADRCSALGRKSSIRPLLSPAAKELFSSLIEKYGTAFTYKG